MNFTEFLAKRSIKFNISVLLGMVSVILIVIIIAYSIFKLREVEINSSIANAQNLTENYAGQVKSELDEAVQSSEIFSLSFGSTNHPGSENKITRFQANAILKETLTKKKNLLGTWTLWEPNAFDKNDSSYINTEGHDSTGRFIPYWTKGADGSVTVSPLTGYSDMSTGDWYLIPKENKKQFVHALTYPVDGKNITMLTVVTPVLHNNQFLGVTGADISLDWLQAYVEKMQKEIFNGKSKISISTQEGTIAALTGSPELIGQKAELTTKNYASLNSNANTTGYFISNDTLVAYAPLTLGQDNANWQVAIQIPLAVITANAWNQFYIFLAIGIIFLLLRARIESFLINKLTKPIVDIANAAEKIAIGDLNYQEVEITSTELGTLNGAFTKLISSQQHITDVCVGISEGNFALQADVKSEKDTLGTAVNKMILNLKNSAIDDAKRNWTSDGLAKFAEILRSNSDLNILTSNIIVELVKYVNANQGGIFIQENEKASHIDLVACYAYERKKFIKKSIEIGEGLVGQCFLEKSRIFITEVPAKYVNITSGLGDATPRCILLVPLLNNEKVEGVIELASFHVLEEHEIVFIEKVAESIASTLTNIKTNHQTAKLLAETQAQSAQMQSQEEEMRQNLEEMTAIQEEMQRKENDYISRIQELEDDIEYLKNKNS
jgi:HAMP domain-containing protein